MSNQLTNKDFWKKRWKNYTPKMTKNQQFFEKYIPENLSGENRSFIEIGGFPGTFSIFFHKKYGFSPTLLDFYMDEKQVHELEKANELQQGTIKCIEQNFFNFNSTEKYDFVFSAGFIEHFEDTSDVIKRHYDLVANGGDLFILLPNFLGLNGYVQKWFNRENYDAHNLKSMDISRLRSIVNTLGMKDAKVSYVAKNMLWLDLIKHPFLSTLVRLCSYPLKLFPIPCKFLSSYIYISANKK